MGDVEGENYDSLLRNLTNANTMLLNDASETLEFNSLMMGGLESKLKKFAKKHDKKVAGYSEPSTQETLNF